MPTSHRRITAIAVLAASILATAFASALASTPLLAQRPKKPVKPVSAAKPTLVVFITVDQMRADYFTRFGSQLTGGLARLYRGGAVMTNGYQDHAITETAPGHSATMSGRFPVHTGIKMNSAGVNDPAYSLIGAQGTGASPNRFNGTTLTDWMRAADPKTKVLSISRKDRGAILPIGKSKSPVFWYASNGMFTTSTYYGDTLPAWLVEFNNKRIPQQFAGKAWTPLLADSAYAEPDSVPLEKSGNDFTFPHVIPSDPEKAAASLASYPFMDQVTLEAALAGVRAMKLGAGSHTDLLAVSLSTTDAVGHAYGPDSKEIHDQILRLDRYLGAFFDTLFKMRDSTRIIVALTADHGIQPIPGVKSRDPNDGAINVDIRSAIKQVRTSLAAQGVSGNVIDVEEGAMKVDRTALAARHINADSLVTAFRDTILKIAGVARADRISELQRMDTVTDAVARRWLHMFASDSDVDLVISLKPFNYWGSVSGGGVHGSPNDLDAHVPIVFYGAAFRAGKYTMFSRVVDMAPTLAAVLGVRALEPIDGRPLREIMRPAGR